MVETQTMATTMAMGGGSLEVGLDGGLRSSAEESESGLESGDTKSYKAPLKKKSLERPGSVMEMLVKQDAMARSDHQGKVGGNANSPEDSPSAFSNTAVWSRTCCERVAWPRQQMA